MPIPLSVIIPTLNEAATIPDTLSPLQAMRGRGVEVLLVDGGSSDGTPDLARPWVDRILVSKPGRARQMNCGARLAVADTLWFLHADTRVPESADELLGNALGSSGQWGYFAIRLSSDERVYRVIEWFMNQRVRWTSSVTGDHGLFVRRALFLEVAGYPDIALMEDIALSQRLRRYGPPRRASARLVTSSRKWEREGVLRTIGRMWLIRAAYRAGVCPQRLARWYYGSRTAVCK